MITDKIPYQSERYTEVTQNCRPFILIGRSRYHTFLVREITSFSLKVHGHYLFRSALFLIVQ